jgi:hypothetical protein
MPSCFPQSAYAGRPLPPRAAAQLEAAVFPWLWIFAPQTWWPLSSGVSQDLSNDAFFRGIPPGAGVPAIEKRERVFDQASYGKQLGWLIDVLVATDTKAVRSPEAREALDSLKKLHDKIQRIKQQHRDDRADAAIALLKRIEADSPAELQRVLDRYQARRGQASADR